MNCRKARECLPDYIDGSLKPILRPLVAGHLDACAGCGEEHRLLLRTRRLLSTYGTTPAPMDFSYLAARMIVPRPRSAGLLWLQRGVMATAAAAAIVVVAWQWQLSARAPSAHPSSRIVMREVAEVDELHQAFAVQQSLDRRDGLLLFAPKWAEREQ